MLTQIHVRDLVTIEELHLALKTNTTMITGETGAGKSIFIEAIELALGGRASINMVRAGKDKAEISLTFDITHFPHVIDRLNSLDLYADSPECIIRRVITSDGRSRSYVNGTPSTLQLVKELGELLFHLHGQYEQQVLFKTETQRDMLDRFAEHLPLAAEVKTLAENWRTLTQQINLLHEKSHERTSRSDYLRFQLEELNALKLQSGEWEQLETEHHRLTHAEELTRNIQHALDSITENEQNNLLSSIHDIRKIFDAIHHVEPKAIDWINTLHAAAIQLTDLESELKNYLEHTELDPEKLQYIEERVSQIFTLSRKHKITPQELISLEEKLSTELKTLECCDDNIQQLELQRQDTAKKYQDAATRLSAKRLKAAAKLEKEITSIIRSLSLPHGEFQIQLEPVSTTKDKDYSLYGNEKIIFTIKTNPDQVLQPIAKAISGGELSRLSLAAHLALANRTTIPTLIFDEVDTGLSGATAEKIGKLLRKLGHSYQVFCITHQPQVAACGHHHLLVEKYFKANSTHTSLRLLNNEEKTREIARMLGGEKITEKTLAHAREVLELCLNY
jgi:DNA repair protein RecN (Recombination protein N)